MPSTTTPPDSHTITASLTSETTHLVQPWPTPSSSPHPPPSAYPPHETPAHHIRISVSQSTSIVSSLPRGGEQPHGGWPRGPLTDTISSNSDVEMQDIPLDDGQVSGWVARQQGGKQQRRQQQGRRENRWGWVRGREEGKRGEAVKVVAVVGLVALVVVVVVIGVTGASH